MRRLALIAALILFAATPAMAAKPGPGSSCVGQNTGAFTTSGGQETGSAITYFLVCDGTNWQPFGVSSHASSNAGFGYGVLYVSGGTFNTAVGDSALTADTTGHSNAAFGTQALFFNTTGNWNTAIGHAALDRNTIGIENTAIGETALFFATGSNNTGLGYGVGSTTLATGSSNILIGTSAAVDTPAAGTNNFLNIGNTIFATGTMTGTVAFPAGNVGIGTTSPQATFDVNGYMRLAKNNAQPVACAAANDGAVALTHVYTLCICKGGSTAWVKEIDGSTACSW